MKKLIIDKIGSVLKNANLRNEVEITHKFIPLEWLAIAARVLDDKRIYNKLELPTWRFSTLKKNDIIAVSLWSRRALRGFVWETPKNLIVGDVIHLLNLWWVAWICESANIHEVWEPLKIEVLWAIVNRKWIVSIEDYTIFKPESQLNQKVKLIIVSWTCMDSGKTTVACELTKHLHHNWYKVMGAKLAWISALRDIENMKDYWALEAISFTDAWCSSTVNNKKSVEVSKWAISYLSKKDQDFVIIEFWDWVYWEYWVMDILKDKQIQKNIVYHVWCAQDPMWAAKLKEVCEEIWAPLDIISWPITDNLVWKNFIKKYLKIGALNALNNWEELYHNFVKKCLKK